MHGVALASAELYDPASGTWTATGSLTIGRDLTHGDAAAQRQGARRFKASRSFERHTQDSSSNYPIVQLRTWKATVASVIRTAAMRHERPCSPIGNVPSQVWMPFTPASRKRWKSKSSGAADFTLVSAASVKGPFAIDLPVTGPREWKIVPVVRTRNTAWS